MLTIHNRIKKLSPDKRKNLIKRYGFSYSSRFGIYTYSLPVYIYNHKPVIFGVIDIDEELEFVRTHFEKADGSTYSTHNMSADSPLLIILNANMEKIINCFCQCRILFRKRGKKREKECQKKTR